MKALIAMSGGVDSSAAALLTKDMGYECIGCTMALHGGEGAAENSCGSASELSDAAKIAEALGMPYHVLDYRDEFREKVIKNFSDSYFRGLTPNPCIECNRCLKFSKLLEQAEALGCEKLVTGHYARIEQQGERFVLKKALDPEKDQSYVLYTLTQEQLSRVLFPLGGMRKQEVRALAAQRGFVNANRPDSQDICFVPDGDYAKLLESFSGEACAPGDFVDEQGKVLGQHRGIIHYTVGQRKGLGIAWEHPLYVLRIEPEKKRVVLGPKEALKQKKMLVTAVNWISGELPTEPLRCMVKNRYRQKESMATLEFIDGQSVLVEFDEPKEGAAPGQSAVFYDGDVVLGGGIISRSLSEE